MARDTVMKKPKDTRGALRRILRYLGPWKYVILGVAVLCLLSNLLNLWGPPLAGSAIREASAGPGKVNFDAVTHDALLMLVCYVSAALLGFGITLMMTMVSKRVARRMRQDVFNKLMRLPVSYLTGTRPGTSSAASVMILTSSPPAWPRTSSRSSPAWSRSSVPWS